MKNRLRHYSICLNGVLAIIFGLVALFFPGITLVALGIYFAITILIGGIALTVGSVRVKESSRHWYFLLLEGIIGILLGIIILARPELVATIFVTIIGIWAIIIGLVFLFTWFKRSLPPFPNTFALIISILSLLVGLLIIINPFESTRIITILIGIYALIYGLFSVINSSKIYGKY
jgi:uncharacterized membrane protein HdeD (DUF308 family)